MSSLINTAVKPFKATAFHDGEFVQVTDADLKGKWSVVLLLPGRLHLRLPDRARRPRRPLRRVPEARRRDLRRLDRHALHAQGVARHVGHHQARSSTRWSATRPHAISRNFGVLIEDEGLALRGTFVVEPGGRDQGRRDQRPAASAATRRNCCARCRPRSTSPRTRAKSARPSGRRARRRSRRRSTSSARSDAPARRTEPCMLRPQPSQSPPRSHDLDHMLDDAQCRSPRTLRRQPIATRASCSTLLARRSRRAVDDMVTLSTDDVAADGDDARAPPSFAHRSRRRATCGIRFAGIPMGHEFTSLVLALLQAGGHPPKVDASRASSRSRRSTATSSSRPTFRSAARTAPTSSRR